MLGLEQTELVTPVRMSTKPQVSHQENLGVCIESALMIPQLTPSNSSPTGEPAPSPSWVPGETPKNPVLVPSYVQLESLENRAPVPQILVVTKEQLAGFSEVLKTFREQDYFHIQAQKLQNPRLKKIAQNLAKHN